MAVALGWSGHVDTDLKFSEFFNSDHTLCLRFLPHWAKVFEGPCIAEKGQGAFALGQGSATQADPVPHLYAGVGGQAVAPIVTLVARQWHHLALVGDVGRTSATFRLYLNGSKVTEFTVSKFDAGWPSGTLRFGKRSSRATINKRNAQFFGLLTDVGIFTEALSDREISALAAPGKRLTGSEPNLLAGYTFREGPHPTKLLRPSTLRGEADLVPSSANLDSVADAALLPLPRWHEPLDLPFPVGEAWATGQAYDGNVSHWGLAVCTLDMGRVDGPTDGAPLCSAAPGVVEEVQDTEAPGTWTSNVVDVKHAPGQFASYVHLRQNGAEVTKGQPIKQLERVGLTGNTGLGPGQVDGGYHLHFAINDKPDQTEGFVTLPVAFSDYELQVGDSDWKPVARGMLESGDVVRNPPTPAFLPASLTAGCAVTRAVDKLDLIATDIRGRVWTARWRPDRYVNNWDRWRPVLSDIGHPRPIGVVARSAERLDIVCADGAGGIYTGGWHETLDNGVWGGWWRVRDVVAEASSPVSIVARAPTKLDVFAIRKDGEISTAAWDRDVEDGKWRGWWQVAEANAPEGSPIAAISRSPNQLDIFVVGQNGGIYTSAWNSSANNGQWLKFWRIGDLVAEQRSWISAVARSPSQLDIFVVAENGQISTAAWDRDVDGGKWRGWWSVAGGETRPGAPVSVVSRHPQQLDVFTVMEDGGVYTAAWNPGANNGKWEGWWRVLDLQSNAGSAVAAVSRHPDQLDVFAVRTDGQMSTAAWNAQVNDGKWQGWWRIG